MARAERVTEDTEKVSENIENISEPLTENEEVVPVQPDKEMVTVQLFKDNGKYRDDLTVGVNGKIWRIKRGLPVKVPKYVAEVIENSMRQDDKTIDMLTSLESDFEESNK